MVIPMPGAFLAIEKPGSNESFQTSKDNMAADAAITHNQ